MLDLSDDLSLTTKRFTLVPLADSDRDDLYVHLSDPAVTEHMDIEPLPNREAAMEIIAWAKTIRAQRIGARWSIRTHDGAFAGTAGFNTIVRDRASRAEIAFDVVKPSWRQGVASEALAVLIPFAFGPLAVHRLEAMVTPGNTASCALLERHGFRLEGTLADYAFWKGRFWDQHIYGRIR